MSQCIKCGSPDGDDRLYVVVETESEIVPNGNRGRKKRVIRETVTEVAHWAVCPDCARKKKRREVLMTIPITLIVTPILTVFSLFAVTGRRRDIRSEVTSWPVVLPIVGVILWICGLSVYLPRSKELYAAEIVRKLAKKPLNSFLLPIDPRCYTWGDKPVTAYRIQARTATKTDLAEKLAPLINGEASEAEVQALVGQTFTKDEYR